MRRQLLYSLMLLGLLASVASCSKSDSPVTPPPPPPPPPVDNKPDSSGTLKGAASFPIGFGIDYSPFLNTAAYKNIVAQEGDNVTFGYNMKHGAIVQNNGSFNFANTDALFNAVTASGLEVFGHTLVWHQNQNATYLNSLTMGSATEGPNVLVNGGFETGAENDFTNWSKYNGGSSMTAGSGTSEVRTGTRSLKATVTANGERWSVQLASDLINTTVGNSYKVTFWVKSATDGGKMRVSTQPQANAQYSPDVTTGTSWTQNEWVFPARDAQTRVLFDLGSTANTYFVDDVTVTEIGTPTPGEAAAVAVKLDTAMSKFIRTSMMRYAGKVKAWDVVNEPMADGTGALRSEANTSIPAGATDFFLWTKYLGRDYALKAFQYARAADPNALLFINDYNLEFTPRKLDSLIAYVTYLKGKGAQIDGIGTQMHMSTATSKSNIDAMFRKLAATGLKVRVSELDIRVNPGDQANFTLNSTVLSAQADMYSYVIKSYIQNVPAAQRHGVTIWGITDADSWIVGYMKKNDFPLLFDKDYGKKPAYYGALLALKSTN